MTSAPWRYIPLQMLDVLHEGVRDLLTLDGWTQMLHDYVLLYPAGLCITWLLLAFVHVFRREVRLPFDRSFMPRVTAVVPAHNEESSLTRTLEALLASDYGALQIHVVSDGSTDRTVSIAGAFADRGVVVHELKDNFGKSKALQHVLDRCDSELFMVIDADTIVDQKAVSYMVQQLADRQVAAVTAHPRVANVSNLLTAVQAMEYASIIGLIKRADSFWGGLSTISGAAACFRTSTLREVGGWSSRSATEDIEISWRLQKAGHRLEYDPRAIVQVQAPDTLPALWRQRRRWAQGMIEVLRIHGGLLQTRNIALIPLALQSIATLVWIALVLASVVSSGIGLLTGSVMVTAAELGQTYMLFAVMLGLFTAQSLAACTFDSHYTSRSFRLVPLAGLYPVYYWVVIVPSLVAGVARGVRSHESGRWARTARAAALPPAALNPG